MVTISECDGTALFHIGLAMLDDLHMDYDCFSPGLHSLLSLNRVVTLLVQALVDPKIFHRSCRAHTL